MRWRALRAARRSATVATVARSEAGPVVTVRPVRPACVAGGVRAQRRALLASGLSLLASGCGFQLRGAADLPFSTFYSSVPQTSQLGGELRRTLRLNGATIVERRPDAQVRFDLLGEVPEREITALSTSGRPREFQLRLRLRWQVKDSAERDLIPSTEMVLRRLITVADNQGVANQDEEELLFRDMRSDAVQQILRRLASIRMPPA
jgi:LPS-assembly lipoprotein